ncbi:MAG: twin-arginine translocase subunit TatB [Gammaproteobacteria bacterium]|nr:twin-arginine translocase subunit TatB [Gammaproteobacteria bacterium]
MFDVGFWEILVIAVVALLVVGPDEFPTLVRKASQALSKARQFASAVKTEFQREVEKAEEIKRKIEQETRIAELHKMLDPRQMELPVDNDPRRAAPSTPSDADTSAQASIADQTQSPVVTSSDHKHEPTQKS